MMDTEMIANMPDIIRFVVFYCFVVNRSNWDVNVYDLLSERREPYQFISICT